MNLLATSSTVLSGVVTSTAMNGVLDEVVGLLPVCIPVMISFIGLRKGISFIQSVLHSA
jgi:ABC-type transport system involved in cytochrome c biogenesis permease component